jgi:hypothetical protein
MPNILANRRIEQRISFGEIGDCAEVGGRFGLIGAAITAQEALSQVSVENRQSPIVSIEAIPMHTPLAREGGGNRSRFAVARRGYDLYNPGVSDLEGAEAIGPEQRTRHLRYREPAGIDWWQGSPFPPAG